MKRFKELMEDKDYILAENEKFSERQNQISVSKRKEMKEYYSAYKLAKETIELELEGDFLELSDEFVAKRKAQLKELEESEVVFALKRMTGVISIGESSLYDFVYFFERAKDDMGSYYRMQDFIHCINAFYDITGEKPVNRLAWGWNQYHKKSSPMGFLYGCVRNYLKRNNKFDKKQFNRMWFGRFG